MVKKIMMGECYDILKMLPMEQLGMFSEIRKNEKMWSAFKRFCQDQKMIKMDSIYRLSRPRTQDDLIKNQIDQEYYKGRIADLVVLQQIMENADDELERRARKEK
jgi:hypothetical protein